MNTTCQVCGRAIKAGRGKIALHGYRRPGQGWQTGSCFGARYRPFEVACDALKAAIEAAGRFILATEERLAAWTTDPPASITVPPKRDAWSGAVRREGFTVERPQGFTTVNAGFSRVQGSYDSVWYGRARQMAAEIAAAQDEVKFLSARLATWVPPAATPAQE